MHQQYSALSSWGWEWYWPGLGNPGWLSRYLDITRFLRRAALSTVGNKAQGGTAASNDECTWNRRRWSLANLALSLSYASIIFRSISNCKRKEMKLITAERGINEGHLILQVFSLTSSPSSDQRSEGLGCKGRGNYCEEGNYGRLEATKGRKESETLILT